MAGDCNPLPRWNKVLFFWAIQVKDVLDAPTGSFMFSVILHLSHARKDILKWLGTRLIRYPIRHWWRTRYYSWLVVKDGGLVQLGQIIPWRAGVSCGHASFYVEVDVMNPLNDIAPYFVGNCWQTVAGPAGAPDESTVEAVVQRSIVGNYKTGTSGHSYL